MFTSPMANDDDEDEKTPEAPKEASPSAMLIQKKFLEQRKLFLWAQSMMPRLKIS